jgi:hypothetical protein
MSGKELVKSLRTDTLGAYDFGEVPSGRYRIHVHINAFCAPQVVCKADGCSLKSKLKLNSKNLVTVY